MFVEIIYLWDRVYSDKGSVFSKESTSLILLELVGDLEWSELLVDGCCLSIEDSGIWKLI